MKKWNNLLPVLALSFSLQAVAADTPSQPDAKLGLKCYAFYGATYQSSPTDPQQATNTILEQTLPILNGQVQVAASNEQLAYDATYTNTIDSQFFRLELTDKTTGQKSHFFGPVSALTQDADTCVFLDPSHDSKMKLVASDIANTSLDGVDPSILRIDYATAQCDLVTLP